MLINNFDEWQRLKISDTPEEQVVQCPDCHGEGSIYDECTIHGKNCTYDECCALVLEQTCGLCDGDGKLKFGDLPDDKINMLFNKETYHSEIISDLERLASWEGKNRIGFLLENGYSVCTVVANKSEKVSPVPVIGI
ncbi:MAG: hypothetical protein L3K25_07790 [Gammaproteobacteria bacterium]|nr:hypothetical protein [Gammaproteobacteria bacterium]